MSSPPGSPFSIGSPVSPCSNVLTPSRKVQALLAQFDDSDADEPSPTPHGSRISTNVRFSGSRNAAGSQTGAQEDDDSEEEDDLPMAPQSKIAARLQGLSTTSTSSKRNDIPVPERSRPSSADVLDDEGILQPGMRRRLLTKRKSSPVEEAATARASRSASPSSASSLPSPPSARPHFIPERSGSDDGEDQLNAGKSKFLALVAKHRTQRLEREAEEEAKRKSRHENLESLGKKSRQPRGSSPADDTEEDSDVSGADGAKKLSTQGRPTRKASKKAIEEMSRETQRMTRNMQLAHQARTKKKITKDSLLARFNFPMATSAARLAANREDKSPTPDSSSAASDNEGFAGHDTPPTSPLHDETRVSDPGKQLTHAGTAPVAVENQQVGYDLPSWRATVSNRDKGKGRAPSEEPMPQLALPTIAHMSYPNLQEPSEPSIKPTIKPHKSKRPLAPAIKDEAEDSDSDLEVITSKGDSRKYAAFEQLPRRKAKEAPSHLALRSLAHLNGGDERKHAMNAAEMQASLRKAARLQARQERQQKIEDLKAKGVFIQTSEEREREQQDLEDLVEKARQEAAEIQKREKALAKKEGNYIKDALDDDDSDEDEDFEDHDGAGTSEESGENGEDDEEEDDHEHGGYKDDENLLDNEAGEDETEDAESDAEDAVSCSEDGSDTELVEPSVARKKRAVRVLSDDDDEDDEAPLNDESCSPQLPAPAKTPQSVLRSARKQIPGLQMSDDLPMGLTQAFAATMADTQNRDVDINQEQDSLIMTMDLPSPNIAMVPRLQRVESIDIITDSQPASQTQPLNVDLSFSEVQTVPQSPANALGMGGHQFTPSQPQFEPTQDGGFLLSPFAGNRFATETPQQLGPHSSVETVMLPNALQDSPLLQRTSRLGRGRAHADSEDEGAEPDTSAFDIMRRAAKKKEREAFDKSKSHARDIIDEAAEESEDEYAGLGGASDEEGNDEENEEDRAMIDEDTQVGVGDEAKLAKLFADRDREQDEAAVSKLMKDITTGAFRRKRGNDDLDLSDEEDAANRRREAKRREFAKMRRELLKDEAVGKIAEDKKKEAFLRSIEDREVSEEDDFDQEETQPEEESQEQESQPAQHPEDRDTSFAVTGDDSVKHTQPLGTAGESQLNQIKRPIGRTPAHFNRKPTTLAEIRESVSFLIEDHDSQAATIDLGLSDSEDEPEAYVNLDRHFQAAEADENADDGDDLGDFIVDDDGCAKDESAFKRPGLPYSETRAPYSERRTKERPNVVNRLSMLRQSSSSSGSSSSTKMAFYTSASSASVSFGKVPSLLRRATTNSSLGSMAGRDENVSATGVVINKPERGKASDEREFVRKAGGGRRNAVNYRPTINEEKMSQRAGIAKKTASKGKKAGAGFLGGLFRQDSWA
ncbi:hypothetical protein PV05_01437 [Exophiala xenobiotica]|uniref:DNA replication checkpoint mediator MRC1 domain-containing protein n=1 Tax=Exophiala xenobiotica TaxID=348802 RepID=A0A0D2FME6_9EURO|nr:uncharacterized protein PV05_01437 [Exophiala xenobiotica]KIW61299.1 hypothetical protein PV05_01437 [Exophiala xenobiotica]